MPWCDTCAKFWNPPSLEEGHCPSCGNALQVPESSETDHPNAPWHFKLLLVALVLYLSYRGVQGVVWVAHHL